MAALAQDKRFDVLFKSALAYQNADEDFQRIRVTASSDSVDLGQDRFMLPALRQMAQSFPGMTIFLNHSYVVPEDVFGTVDTATIVPREGRNDLDLVIKVNKSNPRALIVYDQILCDVKLGVSVGVLVQEAEIAKDKVDGKKVLNILSVKTLEASIVGIPANVNSWVQGAVKALTSYFGEDFLAKSWGQNEDGDDDLESAGQNAGAPQEQIPTMKALKIKGLTFKFDVEDGHCCVEDCTESVPDDVNICDTHMAELLAAPAAEPVEAEPATAEEIAARDQFAALCAQMRALDPENKRKWFTIKAAEGDDAEDSTDVFIYDVIGSGWFGGVSAQEFVEELAEVDSAKINLHINSPGGVITEAVAIKNALDSHPATVKAYVDGMAASSASFVALGCDELVMQPGAMMMIHEPWSGLYGNAAAFAKESALLDKFANNIAAMYVAKAGGTVEDWRATMGEETWYTDQEAVDAGLADSVGNAKKDATTKFAPSIYALYKNAPEGVKKSFFDEADPEMKISDASSLLALTKGVTETASALRGSQVENTELREKIASLEADIKTKDSNAEDFSVMVHELLDQVGVIMETPMARKITPEATFTKIADKYPWLDERIVNQLARMEEPTN